MAERPRNVGDAALGWYFLSELLTVVYASATAGSKALFEGMLVAPIDSPASSA